MKRFFRFFLALAAVSAATGCTTAMRKTTPFYKATAPSSAMAAKAAEGKSEGERATDRVNVWPLAYWNCPVGSVAWPILTFSEDHFALFPLYSQFRQDGEGGKWDEFNVLWPLAQFDTKGRDYRVFPVFWGETGDGKYNAVFPLWVKTPRFFATPLAGFGDQGFWTLPWLGAWGRRNPGWHDVWHDVYGVGALGLVSWHRKWQRSGGWLFPVFNHERHWSKTPDETTGNHWSLALGLLWESDWKAQGGRKQPEVREISALAYMANWRWVNGTNIYWRFWPLAGRGRDADFAERWTWLDGEKLPDGVKPIEPAERASLVARVAEFHEAGKWPAWPDGDGIWLQTNWVAVPELPHYGWNRKDERWWLAKLAGREMHLEGRWVDGEGNAVKWDGEREAEQYVMEGEREWGNLLVAKGRVARKAVFDAASGAKTGDERRSSGHVLGLLYRWSGQEGVPGEEDWARRRVLWKLWDWERKGKNVSLDLFPGVTWDAKENGYRKAAWLWRLFRWEKDPEKGTAVDVFFLPVWRGAAPATP